MKNFQEIFAVMLGGFLGTLSRIFLLTITFAPDLSFPPVLMLINWIGSLVLGFVSQKVSLNRKNRHAGLIFLLLGTGFLGSFTSFSSFVYEASVLLEAQKVLSAGMYTFLTLTGGILLASLGVRAGTIGSQTENR